MKTSNVISVSINQEDINRAIVQYIHRKHPQTIGLNSISWDWDTEENGDETLTVKFDGDKPFSYLRNPIP